MRVALTGLSGIPFTPRTSFETCTLGSKVRSKTAPQAWAGPHSGWNYGQPAAPITHLPIFAPAQINLCKHKSLRP